MHRDNYLFMKKYLWILILVHVLAVPIFAQSEQNIVFRHNISLQINPHYQQFGDFINNFYGIKNDPRGIVANFRYGYRVHKNIIVGGELRYENEKWEMNRVMYGDYPADYCSKDNRFDIGAYSRFFIDKLPVFKPFADVGVAYRYQHSFFVDYKPGSATEIGEFRENNSYLAAYVAAGFSILMWQDRFNLDLMVKYNIRYSFPFFSWKIGYNFNAK